MFSVLCFTFMLLQDTRLRTSISAERRLMVTLRYLASGADFKVLADVFRIAPNTIAKIVPEVTQSCTFLITLTWDQKNMSYPIRCARQSTTY